MHPFSYQSINPSIRPSIYPSDLASIIPSSHTGSHARRQGRTHALTHMYTCKSTHLFILCPPRPSIARIHTRTFRHAHIYAYIHAYSTGPGAQWQRGRSVICLQPRGRDSHVQPNSFRGDWSWGTGFYSHSLSTAESRKAVVINWRKYVLFVLVNC